MIKYHERSFEYKGRKVTDDTLVVKSEKKIKNDRERREKAMEKELLADAMT